MEQSIFIILLGVLLGASFAFAAQLFYRRGMRAALDIHTKQLQKNFENVDVNIDILIQDGKGVSEITIERDAKTPALHYRQRKRVA